MAKLPAAKVRYLKNRNAEFSQLSKDLSYYKVLCYRKFIQVGRGQVWP